VVRILGFFATKKALLIGKGGHHLTESAYLALQHTTIGAPENSRSMTHLTLKSWGLPVKGVTTHITRYSKVEVKYSGSYYARNISVLQKPVNKLMFAP